jgi:serine/threonine protein phosphatase PrpC
VTTDDAESGNGHLGEHAVLAKLAWALVSEPGDVRPHNEDYAGAYAPTSPDDAWDRGPLWIVADGMGGHAAGEVASRVATEAALASWTGGAPQPPSAALRNAVRTANVAVHDAGAEGRRRGMGTTMVALTLAGSEALVANVGDSRAYRVRGGDCTQLTTDHTRVAEMLRMRMISPEQAANHPARSMLTRSLGAELLVQVDIVKEPVHKGDVFILCTDGMWNVISRAELADVAGALDRGELPTTARVAEQLVSTAITRGTADNVTAVVVRVTSDRPIPAAGARRLFFRRGRP